MEEPETPTTRPQRAPKTTSTLEVAIAFAFALIAADAITLLLDEAIAGTSFGLRVARLNATWVLGRGVLDALAIGALDVWWRRHPSSFLVRRLAESFAVAYAVCVLFQTAEILHYDELGFSITFAQLSEDWTTLRFAFAVWGLSLGFFLAWLFRDRPFLGGLGFAATRWFTDDLVTYVLEGKNSTVQASESGVKLIVATVAILEIGGLVSCLRLVLPYALDGLGIHAEAEPEAPEVGAPSKNQPPIS